MTETRYGTVDAVKTRTGVKAIDLGLADEDALDTFLTDLLTEIADLMDRVMRQTYLAADPIPAGLAGIAADIAADSLRTMVATRQTPVVKIDDFVIRVIQTQTLSKDVLARLKLYSAGRGVVSIDLIQPDIADLLTSDPDTAVFLLAPGEQ